MTLITRCKQSALLAVTLAVTHLNVAANSAKQRSTDQFYVASWNLENLFDTDDDPANPFDDEFLPDHPDTQWNNDKLAQKLRNQARVIQDMNKGHGPDILGFQEVEHSNVIEHLVALLPAKSYGIAYAESSDRRGIDTGLIYNDERFSLIDQRLHYVELGENQTTRDVCHATLHDEYGNAYHVFVNHWPSRRGGEKSVPRRAKAAHTLSAAIEEVLEHDHTALILVLGDFNDSPDDRSVSKELQAQPYIVQDTYQPHTLYNLTAATGDPKGSFCHTWQDDNSWHIFDQIIASGSLVKGENVDYTGVFDIIAPEYMRHQSGSCAGAPFQTYGKNFTYLGGYSDHFPVGAAFTYRSINTAK